MQQWIFGGLWLLTVSAALALRAMRMPLRRKTIPYLSLGLFALFGALGAWIHTGPLAFACFISVIASVFVLTRAAGKLPTSPQ